ncbi:GntR family transcriptional regulator [Cohaesibacter celericrescens]|uniref:GntR family transcriptional regulator n=1 Tax=Cohaesibacter celericrescens TaxID=2067669 RepID=A0A2N5XMJ0_9HYPH|nr:GntR family transcriptional regulator [Cohaesibacter celericrescens]PLW75695.1 GntR family transcriptional regulator [Cohaesibacter celericrescens]
MTGKEPNSWTQIREELLRRINERVWQPGSLIPNESELAEEFQCARTTVNRALRELASAGIVTRKRKAGTRIAINPPHKAILTIPIIREEVEAKGALYRHTILQRVKRSLPAFLSGAFRVSEDTTLLYTETMHFSDNRPFIFEERYTSLAAVPSFDALDLDSISINEWLVQNAPYSGGELSFFATQADAKLARNFDIAEGSALFATERSTWNQDQPITHVRLVYMPGYRMRTSF